LDAIVEEGRATFLVTAAHLAFDIPTRSGHDKVKYSFGLYPGAEENVAAGYRVPTDVEFSADLCKSGYLYTWNNA